MSYLRHYLKGNTLELRVKWRDQRLLHLINSCDLYLHFATFQNMGTETN